MKRKSFKSPQQDEMQKNVVLMGLDIAKLSYPGLGWTPVTHLKENWNLKLNFDRLNI